MAATKVFIVVVVVILIIGLAIGKKFTHPKKLLEDGEASEQNILRSMRIKAADSHGLSSRRDQVEGEGEPLHSKRITITMPRKAAAAAAMEVEVSNSSTTKKLLKDDCGLIDCSENCPSSCTIKCNPLFDATCDPLVDSSDDSDDPDE